MSLLPVLSLDNHVYSDASTEPPLMLDNHVLDHDLVHLEGNMGGEPSDMANHSTFAKQLNSLDVPTPDEVNTHISIPQTYDLPTNAFTYVLRDPLNVQNDPFETEVCRIFNSQCIKPEDQSKAASAIVIKENCVKRSVLLEFQNRNGIFGDDVRVKHVFESVIKGPSYVNLDMFRSVFRSDFLLRKVILNDMVVPDFPIFCQKLKEIYDNVKTDFKDTGKVATYIPQQANVDPTYWGVSVCTVDGQRHSIGDSDTYFCIQSCSKPITYGAILRDQGVNKVHQHIGREPSGRGFNERILNGEHLPHNPMLNSGALMSVSQFNPEKPEARRFELLMQLWKDLSGSDKIKFDNSTYLSERSSADRNFSLAYMMKEANTFPENVNLMETLELYFMQCSIEVTTALMSVVAATLANGGVNPLTNQLIFDSATVRNILSLMFSCGMYDASGEFAFTVGFPTKSGVSGVIMMVIPGKMGMAAYSPRLDTIGNSVKGVAFCQRLTTAFDLHIFSNLTFRYSTPNDFKLQSTNFFFAGVYNSCIPLVLKCIVAGVNIDCINYDGLTALHIACLSGHIELTKLLLAYGAETDLSTSDGYDPIRLCEKLLQENEHTMLNRMNMEKCLEIIHAHRKKMFAPHNKGEHTEAVFNMKIVDEMIIETSLNLYSSNPIQDSSVQWVYSFIRSLDVECIGSADASRLFNLLVTTGYIDFHLQHSAELYYAVMQAIDYYIKPVQYEAENQLYQVITPKSHPLTTLQLNALSDYTQLNYTRQLIPTGDISPRISLQRMIQQAQEYPLFFNIAVGNVAIPDWSAFRNSVSTIYDHVSSALPKKQVANIRLPNSTIKQMKLSVQHTGTGIRTPLFNAKQPPNITTETPMSPKLGHSMGPPALQVTPPTSSHVPTPLTPNILSPTRISQVNTPCQKNTQQASPFAVSACSVTAQTVSLGCASKKITVNYLCKIINYIAVQELWGEHYVHKFVGKEPSGRDLNELCLDYNNRPHNPYINAGSIMCCALLLKDETCLSDRFETILDYWRKSTASDVSYSISSYVVAKENNDRNYCLAYMMKDQQSFHSMVRSQRDIDAILELYALCTSIEVTTQQLSVLAATLANGGVNPLTGELIFNPKYVRNALSLMQTSGMYNLSGEFAFHVGIPAKSSGNGSLLLCVPGLLGLCTSIPLKEHDQNDVSVHASTLCIQLCKQYALHIYEHTSTRLIKNPRIPEFSRNARLIAFLTAARDNDIFTVMRLAVQGMDVNATDRFKRTALHVAMEHSCIGVAIVLLKIGANNQLKDIWGRTPEPQDLQNIPTQ